jgi:hypothetical protein
MRRSPFSWKKPQRRFAAQALGLFPSGGAHRDGLLPNGLNATLTPIAQIIQFYIE